MSCRLQVSTDLVLIDVAACLGKYILLDTLSYFPSFSHQESTSSESTNSRRSPTPLS